MTIVLAITLALITLVVAFGQQEREQACGVRRWMWVLMGVGMVEMVLMPTWPQRILLALTLFHIQLSYPPSAHERYLMQLLAVVGGYLALLPVVSSGEWVGMVTPFLWLLTGLGVLTGLWAMMSSMYHRLRAKTWKGYNVYTFPIKIGWWQYQVFEGVTNDFTAGHLNSNFTQPLQCTFTAACMGLMAQGHWWAGVALPVVLYPFGAYWVIQSKPGQWAVHLYLLAGLILFHVYGWVAAATFTGVGVLLACYGAWRYYRTAFDEYWWDSGRFREWYGVLVLWWRCKSWLIRFCGGGIRSWLQASTDFGPFKAHEKNNYRSGIFSMAHNEYLQQLFEYGAIGFVALLWYGVDVLVKAHALSIGLFWVACMIASAALLSFPWAFYHLVTIEQPLNDGSGQIQVSETRHGSPLFVWLTLLILLLVEA